MNQNQKNIRRIETSLLFGDSRHADLNTNSLDYHETQLLNQLIEKLHQNYLEKLNTPIGGIWGLLSLCFKNRNGIVIYNEYMRLKRFGGILNLNNMTPQFLNDLQRIEADPSTFEDRCEILNLNKQQIFEKTKEIREQNQMLFQLNQRVFAKCQYVSDPGSFAVDILQEFEYEQYVQIRSLWSDKSVSEDRIYEIPQIPEQVRKKKRTFKKNNMFFQQEDSTIILKPKNNGFKGRKPPRIRQNIQIMKLITKNKRKIRKKKAKTAVLRVDSNNNIINDPKHIRYNKRLHKKKKGPRNVDLNIQRKKKSKQSTMQIEQPYVEYIDQNDDYLSESMNTLQIRQDQQQFDDIRRSFTKTTNVFHRYLIQRIDFSNIQYNDKFYSQDSKIHEYIQQQLKFLSNPKKVLKILNTLIFDFLRSSSEFKQAHILYLRVYRNIYHILPEYKSLIIQFLDYQMLAYFSQLVALTTSYIIDDQDINKQNLTIHIQFFDLLSKIIFEFQLNQMSLKHCVEEFLKQYYETTNHKLQISSRFQTKQLKLIHDSIYQGNSIQTLISCRLTQKVLASQGMFGIQVSSTTTSSTCIDLYKNSLTKLTNEQIGIALTLIMHIEDKYPTFWKFEQFSSFLSIVDLQKATWTVKIQNYFRNCIIKYVNQQLKLNNNYKQLLNQILKQTFLGNSKLKQGIACWHLLYLTVVETLLSFSIFKNQFVYRQVLIELQSMKNTKQNFVLVTQILLQSLEHSVINQKQKFQSQLPNSNISQYKQLIKLRKMLDQRIDQQDRHRQFKKSRGRYESDNTLIQQGYSMIYNPSTLPEMLPIKLKFLFEDNKLAILLENNNELFIQTRIVLIDILIKFLINVNVLFDEPQQNSEDEDLNKLLQFSNLKKNYSKFIINYLSNLFQKSQQSCLNSPISLQGKNKKLFLKQFEFYGCKTALKVVADKTISAEITKYINHIFTNKYIHLSDNFDVDFNLIAAYEYTFGALTILQKWSIHKKQTFKNQFSQNIAHLVLNLSMLKQFQTNCEKLIKLHKNVCMINLFGNSQNIIQQYIQAFIGGNNGAEIVDNYLKKYEKYLIKMKSILQNPQQFTLCIGDILFYILKQSKTISKMQLLVNLLKINGKNDQPMLSSLNTSNLNIQRIFRLLYSIKYCSHNMYRVKSIVDSYINIQIFKHYQSLNISNYQTQFPHNNHLQNLFRVIEQYYISQRQQIQRVCLQIISMIINQLFNYKEVNENSRRQVFSLTMQRLIQQSTNLKQWLQGESMKIISEKYYEK